jgi:hypothetical protein
MNPSGAAASNLGIADDGNFCLGVGTNRSGKWYGGAGLLG